MEKQWPQNRLLAGFKLLNMYFTDVIDFIISRVCD